MVHTYMHVWRANVTWIAFPLPALHLSVGDGASLNSLMAAGLDSELKGYACPHPPGTGDNSVEVVPSNSMWVQRLNGGFQVPIGSPSICSASLVAQSPPGPLFQ